MTEVRKVLERKYKAAEYRKKIKKENPWMGSYEHAKCRCNNKNFKFYHAYGGRGIRCVITKDEVKKIWFRDKAYLMHSPTIDRINNDGDYSKDNCRFIERRLNSSLGGYGKINFAIAQKIRSQMQKGCIDILRLAKLYNVDRSTIFNVKLYKTFKPEVYAMENSLK